MLHQNYGKIAGSMQRNEKKGMFCKVLKGDVRKILALKAKTLDVLVQMYIWPIDVHAFMSDIVCFLHKSVEESRGYIKIYKILLIYIYILGYI